MIDEPRILELVNAKIDNELSDTERHEFQKLCETRPDVAKLHDELSAAVKGVELLSAFDPPADLKDRIMAAISAKAVVAEDTRQAYTSPSTPAALTGFFELLRSLFQPRYALQLATIFAGGVLVGGLVLSGLAGGGLFGSEIDPGTVVGTIGAGDPSSQPAGDQTDAPTVINLQGEQYVGTVSITTSARQIQLIVEGSTEQSAVVEIRFQPSVRFFGLSDSGSSKATMLTIEPELITAEMNGEGSLDVLFETPRAEQAQFFVYIKEGGKVTAQEEITVQLDD